MKRLYTLALLNWSSFWNINNFYIKSISEVGFEMIKVLIVLMSNIEM